MNTDKVSNKIKSIFKKLDVDPKSFSVIHNENECSIVVEKKIFHPHEIKALTKYLSKKDVSWHIGAMLTDSTPSAYLFIK